MPSRKTYRILITWKHRKWGSQHAKLTAEGTSIRRAIANALLAFFSDSTRRKERLEAHKLVQVEAVRISRPPAK
jgi:hypothetical protein